MSQTALVLSAGGMFGAYQAGAFKAIAALAPPDIVVGASVGALNGFAIAGGCSPGELIDRWLDPSAGDTLRLFTEHGWRNGWFDPAPLRAQAERLFGDFRPRLPFGVVTLELPGLRRRLFRYPNVAPAHLQATCSIPLFLPSVKIEGKRHVDGGLFEKLPIQGALEMGATRIIAVDSMPRPGEWWMRLAIDFACAFKPRRRYPKDLDLTIVSPSERLGSTRDAVFWKRENIERWVELGRRDAARVLAAEPRPATGQVTLNSVLNP